jgi:long-chain acyl-CoA synthetase
MLPNIPAFALAMLGIVRTGAAQVNVNPLYTPRELEHQLNDAGVEIIAIFSGVSASLAEIIDKTRVRQVISVGLGDGTGAVVASPPVDARLTKVIAFSDALAQGASLAFTPVALTTDDLLFLQYTGGTTGLSKGAALSHGNLVANTEQLKAFIPDALRPGQEVVITALPLYHIFALMVNFITYFSIGAENWLVPNPRDMDAFCHILRESRFTVIEDKEAALGEPGEVCAKGPQVMKGYWRKPEANAAAFTPDGYFRTGDIGVFDEKGFLRIVDRKKDMIIVSGFNVFPNEVEAVAAACAGVAECACVGKPDEKTGEAVRLFVAKAAGASLTADDVIAHCRRELAAYKVPKEVRFLDALPKSNVGKILRKDLRALP